MSPYASPTASPIDRLRTATTPPVASLGNGLAAKAKEAASDAASRPAAPQHGVSVETKAAVDPSQPPIDAERVAEIREALKDGSYPILPVKIADAMIAARLALGLGE